MAIDLEIALFWRKIVSSVDGLVACLDELTAAELNWRPLENANSLFVLTAHTLGNVEENLCGVLCGQMVQRQRAAEFSRRGLSALALQQQWQTLQHRIADALAQLPQAKLTRERLHPRRGQITGREILLVVARHAAEHRGQAELTRDLLVATRAKL